MNVERQGYPSSRVRIDEKKMKEEKMMRESKQSSKLVKLVILALMGTIALILFFLNFPLPFLPPYLKIDFSDVPALIAGLIFSPIASVIVVLVKNLLYLIVTGVSDPIGVLANFVAGILFVLPVSILYHKYHKGVKSIVSGLVTGTIILAVGMSVLNYFVFLPAYAWFMGWDMSGEIAWGAILIGVFPFNLIKGIVVGILFIPLFMKMRRWIEQKQVRLA